MRHPSSAPGGGVRPCSRGGLFWGTSGFRCWRWGEPQPCAPKGVRLQARAVSGCYLGAESGPSAGTDMPDAFVGCEQGHLEATALGTIVGGLPRERHVLATSPLRGCWPGAAGPRGYSCPGSTFRGPGGCPGCQEVISCCGSAQCSAGSRHPGADSLRSQGLSPPVAKPGLTALYFLY